MERLYRQHKDEGLVIVAVSVDSDPALVSPFVKQHGFTFPVAVDPKMEVANAYGVRALPSTFLVDRQSMHWVRYRAKHIEEQTDEGERVRVRVRFDVELEALQFALALCGHVELVDPPELRARVLDVAKSLVSRYEAPPG